MISKIKIFILSFFPLIVKDAVKLIIAWFRQYFIKNKIVYMSSITSSKICLFASFDYNNSVKRYVLNYLNEISKLGYKVIFVTTSSLPNHNDVEQLKKYCDIIVERTNVGLDFYSWKIALSFIKDLKNIESLFITNDSNYGPLFSLDKIFIEMNSKDNDLWGICDNYQNYYHIQSYFMVCKNNFINSEYFKTFWKKVLPHRNKWKIIFDYEIGFTKGAIIDGFKVDSYINYFNVMESLKKGDYDLAQLDGSIVSKNKVFTELHNQSLLFWDYLVEKKNFPFIKTYLLRYNPYNLSNLYKVKEYCIKYNYDYKMIEEHIPKY